jgi:ferritin-like metal-binding protein YciE
MRLKPAYGSLSRMLPAHLESQFARLLSDGLQDIYHAERTLAGAIPAMVINATSPALVHVLEHHLTETHGHITRLETLFSDMGITPEDKTCETMESMVKEGTGMMTKAEKGIMCDTAIIGAAQKVEHFEIAAYGTLRTLAEMLGLRETVGILDQTLDEEKLADTKLSELAGLILYEELKNNPNHLANL